jgi:diguanylate cyclase (GGDEF)-like protein
MSMADTAAPWQLLVQLNETLAGDSTADMFLAALMEQLSATPDLAAGWVGRARPDGGITPLASFGEGVPPRLGNAPGQAQIPPATWAAALHGNQPLYIDDWSHAPQIAWRAALALPLPGGAPAILIVTSRREGFFSTHWPPEFCTHFAAVVGAALEARRTRADLQHAQTLYQTMFKGADLLLTARNETKLLEKLCRLLVETGLFVSATIGQLDDAKTWRHRSVAARHNVVALRRAARRHRPADRQKPLNLMAWLAGRTMIANNYASDPRFATLQQLGRKVGIEAVAALIIRRQKRRFAVLSVTADRPDFFTPEIMLLLERLAGMVSHTLDEFDLKTALRAERETQSRIARRDALTLLPNALAFQEHLAAARAQAARQNAQVAVVKIDLDDFKQVNERFGAAVGDSVLRTLTGRIRTMLPEPDFAARVGGDEFAFILQDWQWTRDIPGFCALLNETIGAPLALPNGHVLHISHAAGITTYPRDNADADRLIRHADMALYAAKAEADRLGPAWRLYQDITPSPAEPSFGRALLDRSALRVLYQPVLEMNSGRIVSVEALARMANGDRLIPPAKFLHDLLLDDRAELFRQVLTTALTQVRQWEQEGLRIDVSVNIDAQILMLDGTIPFLRAAIAQAGVAPGRLALEILETHEFIDLRRARRQIDAVRAAGIRLALDDLGAGYSSVLKIRDLPFDIIKLDRAFIAGLRQQPDDMMFVSVFLTLCNARGTELVVEGVETPDVMDALNMMGVRYAQGFLIAEPMPAAALGGWWQAREPTTPPRDPQSLLGAYAVHLNWLRTFNSSRNRAAVLTYLHSTNSFSLDRFIRERHLGNSKIGQAYEALQALLRVEQVDRAVIGEASAHLRAKLAAAMKAQG